MVFIEAMAFDLPVIAYDWGPIADVVTSDVGVCCSNNNPLQVANAMMAVGKNLNKYSGQGPHRVLKYYTPKVVSENIVKLLK